MGKKAPAPPAPPDPVATAQAQGQMNIDTARVQNTMNRVNQRTPYGNLDYTSDGDRWTATQTLSPEQQNLFDLGNQAQDIYARAAVTQLGQASNALSRPFEFQGPGVQTDLPNRTFAVQTSVPNRTGGMQFDVPNYENRMQFGVADRTGNVVRDVASRTDELQRGVQDRTGDVMRRADFTGVGDPNQARSDVEAALFARMNPQLEAQRAALESRLVNQGITPGSQAWETGMRDYAQMANDARYGAVLNAGQEQSRMFGLGFGQANLNNQAVGQQMANDLERGNFANNATRQALEMDIGRGNFINNSTGQLSQMDLAQAAFRNAAAAQGQGMAIDRGNFANSSRGQAAQMDLANAGFGNQAQQQLFGMDIGRMQAMNAAQQQSLQQALAMRAQPINEASALLTGSMLQAPQFQNVPGVQLQAPDYQGAVGQNYAGQVANWNAQSQRIGQQNAALAQLAGQIGGAAAGFMGGGFTPAGIGKLAFGRT